jgi:N-acetylmuramoyl-L-alanine amidase
MSLDITRHETPHKGPRPAGERGAVSMVIVHGDAGRTDAGTISWIRHPDSRVSYHYLIGRDGQVHQFVDEGLRAWHAGRSEWAGVVGLNDCSIGVCLANDGTGHEGYRAEQYDAAGRLVAGIIERRRIPLSMIRGHDEVSPGRKTDPWPWFDWGHFYARLGLWAGGRLP